MLTSLIMKTKLLKERLERYTCLPSAVRVRWEHWKQWLMCHTPALNLLQAAPLKPVPYLAHLRHRALPLHRCLGQMSHPGSVIHHQLYLVGGITEHDASREAAQPSGDASCLADPAFAGSPSLRLLSLGSD